MFGKVVLLLSLLAISFLPKTVQADEPENISTEKGFAVELDPASFDSAIANNNVFVKFFAPWCGHCKRLHPLWEQLAEIMNVENEPKVIIAKVDCTQQQTLCAKYEVTGYPTLRLFKIGTDDSVKFKGTRDLPTITDFINQQLNGISEETYKQGEKPEEVNTKETHGRVLELNEDTFVKHISNGNHFVKFFAPWCSHCQRLAPIWESLAKLLENETAVSISKLDCTQFRPICQDFEVKGYPTLLWIEDGKKIEKYSGDRDHDTLQKFVQKMLRASSAGKAGYDSSDKPNPTKDFDEEENKQLKVMQLIGSNFEKSIAKGVTFVKFYAPWCGHCQKLSSTWDQLAANIHAGGSGATIAKVDCTEPENKQICIDQQVEGYPTLFAYKNGVRQSEYDGTRTFDELQNYINKFISHDEL